MTVNGSPDRVAEGELSTVSFRLVSSRLLQAAYQGDVFLHGSFF